MELLDFPSVVPTNYSDHKRKNCDRLHENFISWGMKGDKKKHVNKTPYCDRK